MLKEELVKKKLIELVDQINSSGPEAPILFNQQQKVTANMSISGANGRVWIQPSTTGYDVSLSGKSLEKQLYTYMKELFGHECNGYKQTNNNKGTKRQPFWRTSDFKKVSMSIYHYAKTYK